MNSLKAISLSLILGLNLSIANAKEKQPESNWDSLKAEKLWSGKAKIAKKSPRVAVAGYRIAFVSRSRGTKQEKGMSIGDVANHGRDQNVYFYDVLLGGISNAQMQAIADQAYKDLTAQLKSAGLEVLTAEQIKNADGFKDLDAESSSADKPYAKNSGTRSFTVFSASELPLFWLNAEHLGNKGPFALGNLHALNKVSASLDAVLLIPTISFDLADFTFVDKWAKLKRYYEIGAAPHLVAMMNPETTCQILWAKNKLAGDFDLLRLQQSLEISKDFATKLPPVHSPYKNERILNSRDSMTTEGEGMLEVNPSKYTSECLRATAFLNGTLAQLVKNNQK